jgi:hypothetical protein
VELDRGLSSKFVDLHETDRITKKTVAITYANNSMMASLPFPSSSYILDEIKTVIITMKAFKQS